MEIRQILPCKQRYGNGVRTLERITAILPHTIKKLGINRQFTIHSVIAHWEEIVGSDIAAHSRPKDMHRAVLWVTVDTSVWCHHLSMMKQGIMDKINAYAGEKLVQDLRFQAGYLKNCQNENTDEQEMAPTYNLNKIPLDEEEVHFIQEISEGIQDKYLRRKVMRLMRKDFALRKVKHKTKWKTCAACTALCPPGDTHCTVCNIQKREKIKTTIIHLLKEVPWMKYPEMLQHVNCSELEFISAKNTLIAAITQDLRNGIDERVKVMTYIMLSTGAKIEALNEAIINKTMEKFRRKKDVFASRS